MPRRRLAIQVSPIFLLLIAITVAGGVLCTFDNEVMLTTGVVLLVLGGWAVSLCLHEFGHAITAFRGGDTSIENRGYLTLDIRRYANAQMSFVLPLIFLLLGGIPLPGGAVWINHWAIRSKPVRSLVSLAGPLINLVLGVALAIAVALVPMPVGLLVGLSYLALVQVLAFLLNILPVPGLDGYGALEPWLSQPARELGERVRPWAPLALFALLFLVRPVAQVFFAVGTLLFTVLGGDAEAAGYGYSQFVFWQR
ncbi:site-2 protease family protein [Pseudonocardia spinosispora]|uniref:site-2 protease family protein n=1 Tax=Pseudonocardia spinosispora TaxID=103441 RepID=UPI0003F6B38E|nr:site-2 protease family protein [Pseudonocardia spinosispora]